MAQRSVLLALVGTEHLGWAGLRATLRSLRAAQTVAEATDEQETLRLAAALRPDAIVLGTGGTAGAGNDAASPSLLAAELRRCCPGAKIIMMGEAPAPEEMARCLELEVCAYLLWGTLSPARLHDVLELLIEADLALLSGPVLRLLAETSRERGRQAAERVGVSGREQAVLRCLAAGYTRRQIAASEGISLRSVERIVSELEAELQAPSPFVLGMRTSELGLLPGADAEPQPAITRRRRALA